MARRYVRDNRGRFASVGATARGGRLATASGNKRETQTKEIAGGKPAGTIGKNRAAKPAAKPAAPAAKTNKAGLTKAEYEAAAAKAWGRAPGGTAKPKASANEQLDRLATRSGNMVRSRSGLTAAEARKASDLGKATGRRVEVSQGANGGYSVRVAASRSGTAAKGPMFDPKQVARAKRANANSLQAAKHEADGPNSKMSRKASVARRAQQIYSGKVDPKAKTGARLTRTSDPEALRRRVRKIKDNTAVKPVAARRKPVGKIDEAKASRIVNRIDANRPGQRLASASTRRDMNSSRTHERATQFLLAPSARMRKRGTPISVNESVKRAVANASKKKHK